MRAPALLLAALALAAGCQTKIRACAPGTVLLTVDVPAGTEQLAISVALDGADAMFQNAPLPGHGATHGTVELDFAAYRPGHSIVIGVTALRGGVALGSATSEARALASGCDHFALAIAGSGDGGSVDGGSGDGDGGGGNGGNGGGRGGCRVAGDCPLNQACNPATGLCSTACSASQACNGGCCAGATCAGGGDATACALGEPLCASCAGNPNGSACLPMGGAHVCGCSSANDCPAHQACNQTTHTCGAACDANSPCNGGCCSATSGGTCQTGTSDGACGSNGGVCSSCPSNANGHKCLGVSGGGQCGCNDFSNCPATASSCGADKLCVNSCSSSVPCQSGCCSSTTNTCQPGTTQAVCGATGKMCKSCVGNAAGSQCLTTGNCGCASSSECPAGQACNVATGACTTACNTNQLCNGGCCTAASGGTCVAGNTAGACGTSGICGSCPTPSVCVSSYSCSNGTCVPQYSTAICASASGCLAASRCNGSSSTCPPQGAASGGTECASGDTCFAAAVCDGSSTSCPSRQPKCGFNQKCDPGCGCLPPGGSCP